MKLSLPAAIAAAAISVSLVLVPTAHAETAISPGLIPKLDLVPPVSVEDLVSNLPETGQTPEFDPCDISEPIGGIDLPFEVIYGDPVEYFKNNLSFFLLPWCDALDGVILPDDKVVTFDRDEAGLPVPLVENIDEQDPSPTPSPSSSASPSPSGQPTASPSPSGSPSVLGDQTSRTSSPTPSPSSSASASPTASPSGSVLGASVLPGVGTFGNALLLLLAALIALGAGIVYSRARR